MHEQDFENLLRELLPAAQERLSEDGEFTPLGGIIKTDDTTEVYTGGAESQDMPVEDDRVLELLFNEFRQMAEDGTLKAAGVCFNAEVALGDEDEDVDEPVDEDAVQDAIYICLEHHTGVAIDVFMPYERTPGGELGFGELQASDAHLRIFGSGEDGEDFDESDTIDDDDDGFGESNGDTEK